MKALKKLLVPVMSASLLLTITACTDGEENGNGSSEVIGTAPVITGVVSKSILQNSKFIPIEGITATDAEDGDLTDEIKISGSVKTYTVGDYPLTYSVTDSHGNTTSVECIITVELNDESAPTINGVANTTIELGTEFSILENVTATDNIDSSAELTKKITTTGSVNVWAEGEYVVKYNVTDTAGNDATEVSRVVTVVDNVAYNDAIKLSGAFEANEYTTELTSVLDEESMSFGMIKFSFDATVLEDTTLTINIDNATSIGEIQLTENEDSYEFYVKHEVSLTSETLTLTLSEDGDAIVSNLQLEYGYKYKIPPTIIIPAGYAGLVPYGLTEEQATKFILDGVTATDDRDSNADVTYRLEVLYGDVNITTATGSQTVTIKTYDNDGCEALLDVTISIAEPTDNYLKDGTFSNSTNIGDVDAWEINNASDTVTIEDGMMVHNSTNLPGWPSDTSPRMLIDNETEQYFSANNYYLVQFDIASEIARCGAVRFGLSTDEDNGWIDDFDSVGGPKQFDIKGDKEFTTVSYLFYMHADSSTNGDTTLNLEVNLGCFYWDATKESNNKTFIDNFVISEVTFPDSQPPVFSGLDSVTVTANSDYNPIIGVTAFDLVDGDVTSSIEMDDTSYDLTTPGTYNVKFTVSDKEGNVSVGYRELIVLDSRVPTITGHVNLKEELLEDKLTINLLENIVVESHDKEDISSDLKVLVDGVETSTPGAFDFSKAGVYTVTYNITCPKTGLTTEVSIEVEIFVVNEVTVDFSEYQDIDYLGYEWTAKATTVTLENDADKGQVGQFTLGTEKAELYAYSGLFNTTNEDETITNNWKEATEIEITFKSTANTIQLTLALGNGPDDLGDWKGQNINPTGEWQTITISVTDLLAQSNSFNSYEFIQQLMIVVPTSSDPWVGNTNQTGDYVQISTITLK